MPSPGKLEMYLPPGGPGVRVDSHVYPGYTISPYYDSLIAKLIALGKDREEAIKKMRVALEEFLIEGIKCNIPLHKRIMNDKGYVNNDISTGFLPQFLQTLKEASVR